MFGQTTNLIINLDHDEWILDDDNAVLATIGFGMSLLYVRIGCLTFLAENETEVSFFNRELYEKFKADPTVRVVVLAIISILTFC